MVHGQKYGPHEQAEHRRELVNALLSGSYEQASGMLRDKGKYCCLGVACDLIDDNCWSEFEDSGEFGWSLPGDEGSHWTLLPEDALNYYGFTEISGALVEPIWYEGQTYTALSGLNDSGAPFAFIAGLIAGGAVGVIS